MSETQSQYHCHKCLWFYAVDTTDPSDENWTGECRRYAPTPHKYPAVAQTSSWAWGGGYTATPGTNFGYGQIDNTAEHWKWPYCVGGWFCGDFKPFDGQFTSG